MVFSRLPLPADTKPRISTTSNCLCLNKPTILPASAGVNLWVSDSGTIGRPEFILENAVYNRVWDAEVSGKIEAVKLTETVYTREEGAEPYDVDHLAMLYQRQIPNNERFEYLLASLEFYR